MKIAIIGAGAIGGFVGARLALAGEDVTFVARGANLTALRNRGIRLVSPEGEERVVPRVRAIDRCQDARAQDLVIVAVKAHQLGSIAPSVPLLFGEHTTLVTMQNGIPYWYFHRHGGDLAGTVLRSVDPQGNLATWLPPERVLGCVVYPACELVSPGIVRHVEGERFPLGELDGSTSERAGRIAETFVRAGLKAPVLDDIRCEIWLKLWGNLTFNPLSALTRSTLADICRDPLTRELARAMMTEAQAVAHELGVTFRVTIDKRIAGAERVGAHKTSMLQDIEAGRQPEIEALLGSVRELASLTRTHTPTLDAVYALVCRLWAAIRDGKEADVPPLPAGELAATGAAAA
jgi:2-dehydropantoate 2-reductase